MEVDMEEQKKWARAITLGAHKLDIAKQDQKMIAPEIKKLQNNETPPQQIVRRARAQEAGTTHMETEMEEEMTATEQRKELLQEQEKLPKEWSTWAMQAGTTGRQDNNRLIETTLVANNKNNVSATRNETHTTQELETHRQETMADTASNQVAADSGMTTEDCNTLVHADEDASQTTGAKAPTEVSPKEWQKHHDQWLNAVMRNAIGEENHPSKPNLHDYVQVHRPAPENDIDVAPVRNYVMRYDLH